MIRKYLLSFVAAVLTIGGVIAGWSIGVWFDRAKSRGDQPDISAWGLLFCGGIILLLCLIGASWKMNKHETDAGVSTAGFILAISCAALTAIGCFVFIPKIEWGATLYAFVALFGVAFWVLVVRKAWQLASNKS